MSAIRKAPRFPDWQPSLKSREDEMRKILDDLSPKEVKIEEELAMMVNAATQMVRAATRIGRAFGQQRAAGEQQETNGGSS